MSALAMLAITAFSSCKDEVIETPPTETPSNVVELTGVLKTIVQVHGGN